MVNLFGVMKPGNLFELMETAERTPTSESFKDVRRYGLTANPSDEQLYELELVRLANRQIRDVRRRPYHVSQHNVDLAKEMQEQMIKYTGTFLPSKERPEYGFQVTPANFATLY